MNYDEFKNYVMEHLSEWFPKEEYDVSLRKVVKNNGVVLDGLCIFSKGEKTSPTLYLEGYYEKYRSGHIMAEILSLIERDYRRGLKQAAPIDLSNPSYEALRGQIIMRLVNYEKNQEILKDCPHLKFHDLAITFRWIAHQDDIGISTALISNREMEMWNVDKRRLYEDAMFNTPKIFPSRLRRLEDLMEEFGVSSPKGAFELYILTNEQGINGATCILYPNLLEDFARKTRSSFYLLPSSIHEMMICPERNPVTEKMLLSLVRDANHMVVTMGEVLSDNIYYFNHRTNQLSFILNPLSHSH